MLETLWVEKYRPRDFSDLVLDVKTRNTLENFVSTGNVPHCLFEGQPGTGKTTIAMILKDKLIEHDDDFLFVNSSGDRGIGFMRDVVMEFMKTPPIRSKMKIVILDECDGITNDGWSSLRNPIENAATNFNQTTRFICTANYVENIPEAIQSRFVNFHFSVPPREYVFHKMAEILECENVKYTSDSLLAIYDSRYPDIRGIINDLQKSSINGELVVSDQINLNTVIFTLVTDLIKAMVEENDHQINTISTSLHTYVRENEFDISGVIKNVLNNSNLPSMVYIVFNRYMNTMGRVISKPHHFMAMIYEAIIAYKRVKC